MRLSRWCLVLAVAHLLLPARAATPAFPDGLRPPLGEVLRTAGPDTLVPVSIVLHEQARPEETARLRQGLPRGEGRHAVLRHLREIAGRTQAPLLARLRGAETAGHAARLRPLFIGNVVGVDATPAVIREIARRPEVAWVNYNPKVDVFLDGPRACVDTTTALRSVVPLAPAALDGADAVECGTALMEAPRVWNELGNTGAGAVIAVIDTGVCWTHPDIANQIWVNPGEDLDHDGAVMDADDANGVDDDGNGFVDDFIGWNFDYGTNQPSDENGHGSHCAGSVAGDGTSGTESGMAPDAKVMVLRVGVTFADEVDVWSAMQYAADNGAGAISMSLGWPHGQNPDRFTWRTNCENVIDAGTAMVIAAGNEGSGAEPDNVRTPGDVPRVITVAAVDCNDGIAGFSSRGPVTWQDVAPWNDHPWPPGLVKPDVAGPGVDTQSHSFCSGYTWMSGTSMATPHVAGAVALMLSASPGLEHDTIKEILENTAIDLGAAGRDNEYGAGRVDAYQAVLNSANPRGRATIKQGTAGCTGTLDVSLADEDLRGAGSAVVLMTSTSETGGESVTLTETNPGSGLFKGTIALAPGAPSQDGVLQVADADTATVTYLDADDGTGASAVSIDTALLDCAGPAVAELYVTGITNARATIHLRTAEPATATVEWGATPALGEIAGPGPAGTVHDTLLNQFDSCLSGYFRVRARDAFGNETVIDDGGAPFRFLAGTIPGLYWRDNFESGAPGWTLTGEWQTGPPQGRGGSSLLPDPAAAYNNVSVLGLDLTGLGSFAGDYERGVNQGARSPTQSATSWQNTKLMFYRHLNTHETDVASLLIWVNGVGRTLFRTDGSPVSDGAFQLVSFDLRQLVDGANTVFLEFKQQSDDSGQASGWNIDDVIFKNGALPDYGPCGGCAATPSFAGLAAASDVDGCAPGGIALTWGPAVSWGSGATGTYAVYRGTSADFVPGPATLVADGLTGTSWTDTAAPLDQQLYYVVRAENDEACGGGPNNGGGVDGNTRRVAARDETSQVLPSAVSSLGVDLVGMAHVRLAWDSTAGAASYRVKRSLTPQAAGFAAIADAPRTLHEDLGAGADGRTYFYLVNAADACGNEGP